MEGSVGVRSILQRRPLSRKARAPATMEASTQPQRHAARAAPNSVQSTSLKHT